MFVIILQVIAIMLLIALIAADKQIKKQKRKIEILKSDVGYLINCKDQALKEKEILHHQLQAYKDNEFLKPISLSIKHTVNKEQKDRFIAMMNE